MCDGVSRSGGLGDVWVYVDCVVAGDECQSTKVHLFHFTVEQKIDKMRNNEEANNNSKKKKGEREREATTALYLEGCELIYS